MYFSSQNIIPFIKTVDELVRQVANNTGMKKHGKMIVEVASEHVKSDPSIKNQALLLTFETLNHLRLFSEPSCSIFAVNR